jgi:hypothetical protein
MTSYFEIQPPLGPFWFLVIDPSLRKLSFVFVKVADFDQRRPDLQSGMNLAYHVVDYPRHILLEKVGFKSIKTAREILREKFQRLSTSLVFCPGCSLKYLGMHCGYLFEYLLAVRKRLRTSASNFLSRSFLFKKD